MDKPVKRIPPAVTVAVVSWNTRDLLAACLESMAAEVEQGRVEVVVVDNDSSDGSAELVEERFPWVRLHRAGENLGFGRAVNWVGRRSMTPWIAPANADTELTPGAMEALLAAGVADPAAGCLAPRLILPDGSTQASIQRFPGLLLTLGRNLRLQRLSRDIGRRLSLSAFWDPDCPSRVDWATGAFLMVRRDAWKAVDGFDESEWMYAEDLDLAWRLKQAGWMSRYVPEAMVRHRHAAAARQAFGGDWGRRSREIEANHRWVAKRRGLVHARAIALVNAVGAILDLALLAPLAALRPGRHEERLARARLKLRGARLGLGGRSRRVT